MSLVDRISASSKRVKVREYVTVYRVDEVYTKRSQGYYLQILGGYDQILQQISHVHSFLQI